MQIGAFGKLGQEGVKGQRTSLYGAPVGAGGVGFRSARRGGRLALGAGCQGGEQHKTEETDEAAHGGFQCRTGSGRIAAVSRAEAGRLPKEGDSREKLWPDLAWEEGSWYTAQVVAWNCSWSCPPCPAMPESAQQIATQKFALGPDSSVVERGPEKAGVGGSIPSLATTF